MNFLDKNGYRNPGILAPRVAVTNQGQLEPGVRKFGKRLESGFSSAAGIKSACRTYGTLTLGSG